MLTIKNILKRLQLNLKLRTVNLKKIMISNLFDQTIFRLVSEGKLNEEFKYDAKISSYY